MNLSTSWIVFLVSYLSLTAAGGTALATRPLRLASLSPQVSDLILALGKQDNLVASVKRYSGTPHAAVELGSYLHPSLEKIFAVAPTWVVTDDSVPLSAARGRWEAAGARTLILNLRTVNALTASADRLLGEVFGEPGRVSARVAGCLSRLRDEVKPPLKALVFASVSPPILAGRSSFLSDLAGYAGYENLAEPHWAASYPMVTEEWLLTHRPDAVFYLEHGFGESVMAAKMARVWWPKGTPPQHGLPQEPFAKAGFAALKSWEVWQRKTPRECREI